MPNQKCGVKEDVSGVGVGLLKAQAVEQGPVLKYTQNYMYNIHNMQNAWRVRVYISHIRHIRHIYALPTLLMCISR